MDSTLKDRIMTALSQVEDPQLRQDLVSLDMIAGLKASADVTELTLKLVSLRSAHRDSLEAAVREFHRSLQLTPRVGLWIDSSNQSPEQTVDEIIARWDEALVHD